MIETTRTGGEAAKLTIKAIAAMHQTTPALVAEQVRAGGMAIGRSEGLVVTVVMADIRGYSTIAERTDPTALAVRRAGTRVGP